MSCSNKPEKDTVLDLDPEDLDDPAVINKTIAAHLTWIDAAAEKAAQWPRLSGRDAEETFAECGGLRIHLAAAGGLQKEMARITACPLVVFRGTLVIADNGGFAFRQKLRFRAMSNQLKDTRVWQMRAPDQLSPLLRYVCEHEIEVSLLGRLGPLDRSAKGDKSLHFTACDLALEGERSQLGPAAGTHIPRALTRSIILKLLAGSDAPGACYDAHARYSTRAELELLYEFYKDTLPPMVRTLAQRSLLDYGRLRGDEQKHAGQAASFVWEVDWRQADTAGIPPCAVLREKLRARFSGMDDVIERLLEIAAAIRRSGTIPKQGVLLWGPAGGGKTMVASAFAELIGFPLERLDFNSSGDRETLCGTSRIYGNAKMGEISECIRRAHSAGMVLLINELDKAQTAKDGGQNASEALLSVLDRTGFYDNFLVDPIPTGQTFIIATANDISKIPQTLLSRFCQIEVKGYGADDKRQILARALPAALAEMKISDGSITVTDAAQALIVEEYTATGEARGIEQIAARIAHNCALRLEQGAAEPIVYDEMAIRRLLGEGSLCERVTALKPGLAKCVSECDGCVHLCHVEAMFLQGSGGFEVLNGNVLTDTYCREAFLYLRAQHPEVDFSHLDVVIRLPVEMHLLKHNTLGIACYAALLSYLREKALDGSVAFVGGMDMLGNTYLDVSSLDRYLPALAADASVHTVAVPLGAGQRVYCADADGLTLVEAYDAASLNAVCGA